MNDQNETDAPLAGADDVTLGYGARTVTRGICFQARRGERWFLLGPNGQGKTTLLRALLGRLRPRAGRILLHPELEGLRRTGFVPQRCELIESTRTTAEEFVALGLTGLGAPRRSRRARTREALCQVGLDAFAHRDYWSLSGGQRQRVLVARAMVRNPLLLMVDEPTNGLDWAAEEDLLETLTRFNRERRLTLLFVTHNLVLARRHATHALLFAGGRALAGPAAQILAPEPLARAYGREAPL